MRLSSYLAAILDVSKLRGFPTRVEFQLFKHVLYNTFTNILVKKLFGNDLVP